MKVLLPNALAEDLDCGGVLTEIASQTKAIGQHSQLHEQLKLWVNRHSSKAFQRETTIEKIVGGSTVITVTFPDCLLETSVLSLASSLSHAS